MYMYSHVHCSSMLGSMMHCDSSNHVSTACWSTWQSVGQWRSSRSTSHSHLLLHWLSNQKTQKYHPCYLWSTPGSGPTLRTFEPWTLWQLFVLAIPKTLQLRNRCRVLDATGDVREDLLRKNGAQRNREASAVWRWRILVTIAQRFDDTTCHVLSSRK